MKQPFTKTSVLWLVELFLLVGVHLTHVKTVQAPLGFIFMGCSFILFNYIIHQIQKYYHSKELIHINHFIQAALFSFLVIGTYWVGRIIDHGPLISLDLAVSLGFIFLFNISYAWHEKKKKDDIKLEHWIQQQHLLITQQKIKLQ